MAKKRKGSRETGKLSAKTVEKAKKPGMHGDGGGLYLQVKSPENRCWIFRYAREDKVRYMGLGSLATVTLADAREQATKCRRLLQDGVDPIAARDAVLARLQRDHFARFQFPGRSVIFQDANRFRAD